MINPDTPIARLITAEEGMEIYRRIGEAEKVLGPLSWQERAAIANTFGSELTLDDVMSMIAGQRVLVVREKEQKQ